MAGWLSMALCLWSPSIYNHSIITEYSDGGVDYIYQEYHFQRGSFRVFSQGHPEESIGGRQKLFGDHWEQREPIDGKTQEIDYDQIR